MSKIYDLTQEQHELINQIYWLDDSNEDDTVEIDILNKKLTKIRNSAEKTLEFLSKIYMELHYTLTERVDEENRLKELVKTANARTKRQQLHVDRIKSVMLNICQTFDIKSLATNYCDIRMKTNPGRIVYAENFDAENLPFDFYQNIPAHKEPLTKELIEHLRLKIYDEKLKKMNPDILLVEDKNIPGVMLVRDQVVSIK